MFAYSALVAFGVVFLGEHYLVDVLGAVALASAMSFVGVRLERRQRSAARNPSMATSMRFAPARASERGQNLIEFAMLTPFILGFIAAIIILGLLLNTRSSLQQAVREGARQAAVGASLTNIQNLAAGNAPDTLAPADVRVCYPPGVSSRGGIGDPVRVYIFKSGAEGYPFTIIPSGGILTAAGGGLSPTLRMSPQATARLEKSHTIVDPGDLCLS